METASILDNQDVTADILNNIAVDLGATDFNYFQDNTSYAVDKLNEITKALTGPGVLRVGNMCKVTKNNNTVYVSDGVIVFENGVKITISVPQQLTITPGVINYIYAINDITNNRAYLYVTQSKQSGDCVWLATVLANGEYSVNYGRFSRSKNLVNGTNDTHEITYIITKGSTLIDKSFIWICQEDISKYNLCVIKLMSRNNIIDYPIVYLINSGDCIQNSIIDLEGISNWYVIPKKIDNTFGLYTYKTYLGTPQDYYVSNDITVSVTFY